MTLMNSLQKTLIWSMIAIAVLSAGLVGSLWLVQEYTRYAAEVRSMREDFLAQQKALVKKEVDAVVDFIEYQRSTTEETLKRQTRDRVYRAVAVAENMYNTYRGSRSDEEIKIMIREALRPIRFFSGQDYYFTSSTTCRATTSCCPFLRNWRDATSGTSRTARDSTPFGG